MSSRAYKRNTQGGKTFKSQKKGGENFRTKAAREAAFDMLELILIREKKGIQALTYEEKTALLELQVGRITRKFGNGRFEVYCQDGKVRNCALRGLLKRKSACFVDLDSIVVITLSESLDELESSDDEGYFGGGKIALGAELRSQSEQGYIVGMFDTYTCSLLRKTKINPRLFKVLDAYGNETDDIFDRSEEEINSLDNEKNDVGLDDL
jgi:translation initiation factor IF-1